MTINTAGTEDQHTRFLQETYLAGIKAQLESENPKDRAVIAKMLSTIEKDVRAIILKESNGTTS